MTKEALQKAIDALAEAAIELKHAKTQSQIANGNECRATNAMNEARKAYNRAMEEFLKENDPEYARRKAREGQLEPNYV